MRERNDIVEVVSQYVSLRQKGNRYWGLCPFHHEKTPSFCVVADEQFYHCFGCHAGGDVFHFIQAVERCDFGESLRILAERAHVALPERPGAGFAGGSRDRMDKLYEVGREAARFFHERLFSSAGERAMSYLAGRGLTKATIRKFGLGYAPDSWNGLLDHLRSKGIDVGVITEFGLAREKDGRAYDTFRNRVMFPIIDSRNRVVGFGGRVLDDSLPKYINSPESPVFNKGKILYGIHALKKLGTLERILIVEGFMDLISLNQAGYPAVVASLGTALTQDQARLLRRYCPDVVVAYDADAAGENATLRGMKILAEAGLNVRIATLTDGKDPDDFSRRHGLAGIRDMVDAARPLNEYRISRIRASWDLTDPEQRIRYVSECCREVLAGIESPVERSEYVKRLHMETGVDETAIEEEIALGRMNNERMRKNKTGNSRNNNVDGKERGADGRKDPGISHALLQAQRVVLRYALTGEEAAGQVFGTLSPAEFSDPVLRKTAGIIQEKRASGGEITIAGILNRLEGEESARLVEAVEQAGDNVGDEKLIRQCLDQLVLNKIKTKMDGLTELIREEKDEDKKTKLKKEFDELKVNYHKVKRAIREGGTA